MNLLPVVFSFILARLREPSTLAGLSALGVLFGIPPGVLDATVQLVTGAAALAAVVLPDPKHEAPAKPAAVASPEPPGAG